MNKQLDLVDSTFVREQLETIKKKIESANTDLSHLCFTILEEKRENHEIFKYSRGIIDYLFEKLDEQIDLMGDILED